MVEAFLRTRLPAAVFTLVDVARMASRQLAGGLAVDRYLIEVESLWQADALVSSRHLLKGSDCCLLDVLTEDEQRAHNRLWSLFMAAKASSRRAQFNRARLFVDGVEVRPGAVALP